MQRLSGKSVCKGIAIGPVHIWRTGGFQVERKKVHNTEQEIKRLFQAKKLSGEQLEQLRAKTLEEVGAGGAAIFDAHKVLLEDEYLLNAVCNIIRSEKANAEYAVAKTGEKLEDMFARMDDEYMQARAVDIRDVAGRLLQNLMGSAWMSSFEAEEKRRENARAQKLTEPVIIVAEDLTPSETLQMDREKILAFVTVKGSTNSHTAILARMMNIPAIIGVEMDLTSIHCGMRAVVDGNLGEVVFEPDEEICTDIEQWMRQEEENRKLLKELAGKDNVTPDGRRIDIFANIGNPGDIGQALENDAGGIGLLRSEFLYLRKDELPTEEEQFQAYKEAAIRMNGKKVIVRTLDIGADKQVPYLDFGTEPNPAMGYRAIRICLKHPEIFKTQLKAIFRAAVYGDLAVLYPMITSVWEVEQIGILVKEVCEELLRENVPYKLVKQGVMIETPAAVMISDELAKMVDFFSIGTNDLAQYALAIDRQNEKLDDFFDPYHEAVIRMIRMVVRNAHEQGIPVGICGELAADPGLTEEFLCMGIDELSVAPAMILKIRKVVRECKKNSERK